MDIKGLIKKYEAAQEDVRNKLVHLKDTQESESSLWISFENVGEEFFLNDSAMNFFADSLQLVDNEKTLEKFNLEDIKKIYMYLVKYHPNNLQYQSDLIDFVYNVLDDEVTALALIAEAEQTIAKFQSNFDVISKVIKLKS